MLWQTAVLWVWKWRQGTVNLSQGKLQRANDFWTGPFYALMVLTHQTLSEKSKYLVWLNSEGKMGHATGKAGESQAVHHTKETAASCRNWEAGKSVENVTGITWMEGFWLRRWSEYMQRSQLSKRCITNKQKYTKEPPLHNSLWDTKQFRGAYQVKQQTFH